MKRRTTKIVLLCAVFALNLQIIKADSPLTSTYFCRAYHLPDYIETADERTIPHEFYEFLANESQPVAERLAAINLSGWQMSGMERSNQLLELLTEQNNIEKSANSSTKIAALAEKVSGETLICLAYLTAMDNYLKVENAYKIAILAQKKASESYAVNLFAALINAQIVSENSSAEAYNAVNNVRQAFANKAHDLNSEATKAIFDYMELYK